MWRLEFKWGSGNTVELKMKCEIELKWKYTRLESNSIPQVLCGDGIYIESPSLVDAESGAVEYESALAAFVASLSDDQKAAFVAVLSAAVKMEG